MSISAEKQSPRNGATALATSLLILATGPAVARATFTTFDVSGASATYATGINADGVITGAYAGSDGHGHGFVRAADGTITTFDVKGSLFTNPLSINRKGAVTGRCNDGSADHGFVRSAGGKIKSIDIAGSDNTEAFSINNVGSVTGW